MTTVGWVIIGVGVLIGIVQIAVGRHHLSILKQREDAEADWEATGCVADTADDLLEVVCEAFGFSPKMKPKLRPDDTVIGLYRIVYPRKPLAPLADDMEVETFLIRLDQDLGLPDEDIGPDTSLAEIAERIDNRNRTTGPGDARL